MMDDLGNDLFWDDWDEDCIRGSKREEERRGGEFLGHREVCVVSVS